MALAKHQYIPKYTASWRSFPPLTAHLAVNKHMLNTVTTSVAIAILEELQYYFILVMVQLVHVGRQGRLLARLSRDWLVGWSWA